MARISSSSSTTSPPSSFSAGAHSKIDVGLISVMLFDINPNRKYAYISNNSGQVLYIQYAGDAALGAGIKIPPNTLYTIETTNLWLGSVSAITNVMSALIDIFEGE